LTIEQTVNTDAASRRTDLSSVTNNYSARMGWMLTKSARAAIISSVQEMVGLSHVDDPIAQQGFPTPVTGWSGSLPPGRKTDAKPKKRTAMPKRNFFFFFFIDFLISSTVSMF
jgi:hypothetical protein